MTIHPDDLTVRQWYTFSPAEREGRGRLIAQLLGSGWSFTGLVQAAMAGEHHELAQYSWRGRLFNLIPGGLATLGYDREHPYQPTPAIRTAMKHDMVWLDAEFDALHETWVEDEEPPIPDEVADARLQAYLASVLSPLRHCTIAPFLIQLEAEQVTTAAIMAHLGNDGFRPPSSDEWEYACAAGTRTLFRWGDEFPVAFRPNCEDTDLPYWTGQYGDQHPDLWAAYRQPNAFGLLMPFDPYKWELCSDPDVMRGGDGGHAICGGEGSIAIWTTLASAYLWVRGRGNSAYVRRCRSIP